MKEFHVSDVFTAITGKMVFPKNLGGLYSILNYMSDDNLHTHQLPRVLRECKPYLLEQFPLFKNIHVEGLTHEALLSRVKEIESKYGSYFEVEKLPKGVHKHIDPIDEMTLFQR